MSWEAQGWVWALPDLTPNERLVGLALANYANDLGEKIYPGQERIQAQTGLSESSVRRSIQSLVSSGWLIVVTKGDGRGHATEYRMPVDMQIVADRHAELKGVKSAPPNPERVSHRRKKGVTQTPQSYIIIFQITFQIPPAIRSGLAAFLTGGFPHRMTATMPTSSGSTPPPWRRTSGTTGTPRPERALPRPE